MDNGKAEYSIPKWLRRLQENSWEMEILISGGAIFSLFQLSDLYVVFISNLKMTNAIVGLGILSIVGMFSLKLLTVGFIAHLIFRAFWLALVCINYVFPNGAGATKFNLKFPYKNQESDRSNLYNEIILIDRASGLIMFVSVLSSIIIVGFIILTISFLTIPSLFFDTTNLSFLVFGYVVMAYYFDLLSFGLLRKIPGISWITYLPFKLFDYLTLRVFYNKGINILSTNVHRWQMILGFGIMFTISAFLTQISFKRTMHWTSITDARQHLRSMAPNQNWLVSYNYADQMDDQEKLSTVAYIPSKIISTNHLNLFIPYSIRFDNDIPKDATLSDYVIVSIDSKVYDNLDWFNYWPSKSGQDGLEVMIDIAGLTIGKHELKVTFSEDSRRFQNITFWKDNN